MSMPTTSSGEVYAAIRGRREIALLDVREEAVYATGHPLFAASLPIGRIELEIYDRVPRRRTPIVCYDDAGEAATSAVLRIRSLGYTEVSLLEGGLQAWVDDGLELFSDVNAPSKAFGELVDATLHPPSIEPGELLARIDRGDDLVVLDARRFDEYQVMSIPSAVSVPGGELVRRLASIVGHDETLVVVNCAGRTRSIIGAQSLRNAGVSNEVVALRNGTIGWSIAGLELDHGAGVRAPISGRLDEGTRERARRLAAAVGVRRITWVEHNELVARDATTYCFDVRDEAEFEAGHFCGFRAAPGGQLVQETDVFAPVRGSTIVLADDDGVRADMTGSWLAQMGWSVYVIDPTDHSGEQVTGPWRPSLPEVPDVPVLSVAEVASGLARDEFVVVDLAASQSYRVGHIPGAIFVLRSELLRRLDELPDRPLVLTSPDGVLAAFAVAELIEGRDADSAEEIYLLEGGTTAWSSAGHELEVSVHRWLSPPHDRYRRPYEGTDNDPAAMQAYLEWEYGLVEQLHRDASHGFFVLERDR
jgi:rhodanese-related sulfurtransferase